MFEWMHDGQIYRCVGFEPAVRKNGESVRMFVWRANCATCGKEFECRTVEGVKFTPNRRCDACKRPGVTVKRERMLREAA